MFQNWLLVCSTLLLLLKSSHGLYTKTDDVIELTESNFNSKVTNSDSVWIVEFYSPQCGHCVNFAPEYKKGATFLKGVVNVGAVDASQNSALASKFQIRGYPTVKIFSDDKANPEEFNGQRKAESLVQEGLDVAQRMVRKRTGKTEKYSSSSSKDGDAGVVELTDNNFSKMVLDSDKAWFVGFFAPWCGHCQRLKPDYEAAAKQLSGQVMFGSVDATVYKALAEKYSIKGFPTLYYFGLDKSKPTLYQGGRSTNDMYEYLKDKALEVLPPPKAMELVDSEQLKVCKNIQLCIIAALPDLLDCQSKCRNNYIKMIEKAGEKYKAKGWSYFWFAALAQPEVEKSFNLGGFGYPALVVVNEKKHKYVGLRGSFSQDGIQEFLRDVSLGSRSISLQDVKEMPEVKNSKPWDGKDGKMEDIQEINLDDLKDEL